MNTFRMNGYLWHVKFVNPTSPMLVDRTGKRRVATTDPDLRTIFLSDDLHGPFLSNVLVHELGHCVMVSYGLLQKIHQVVHPRYWIEAEEWICNFIANYGSYILSLAKAILYDEGER